VADPTDPDVIASAPRPTVADRPSRAIATDAELNEASNCGWAEATIDGGDQEARSLRAVADLIASRLTPPTLPADLRGLLDDLVAADEAHERAAGRTPGYAPESPMDALNALWSAVARVIEWHRAHGRRVADRPRCRCTSEAGDTGGCPAHPACDECGEPTIARRKACAEHAGEPQGTWRDAGGGS